MPMDLVHRAIARESHTRVRAGIHKHPGEEAAVCRIFAENAREEKRFAGKSGSVSQKLRPVQNELTRLAVVL